MAANFAKCHRCGEINPSNAVFCTRCGYSVRPLNDQYHIVEDIAKGSLKALYKAEDMECFNRIVAIKKFIPRDESPEARYEARRSCERESALLARLNHHSIPSVHCYFSSDHNWFLVMSFVEGETLESRWQRGRRSNRLTNEEIIQIGLELCNVLHYLHSPQRAIVFRDLKPSNIVLDKDKHLYLVDFGSAYELKTSRMQGPVDLGTPGYAAPELAHKQSSPRSDIYSMGAVLFQLISGKRPPNTAASSEHLEVENHRVSLHTPSRLWDLVTRMMKDDEDERPASVLEVRKDLEEVAKQLILPGEMEEVPRFNRRSLLLGGLLGSLGLAAGGTSVLWAVNRVPPKVIQFPITVGGKLDNEAVLLAEMYFLLLQNAGFSVTDKAHFGDDQTVFSAIMDGTIDIYPEFLLTGLQLLGTPSVNNLIQDFQTVQQGFETQYKLRWLNQAVHLNDNYCVALPESLVNQLGVKTLSAFAEVINKQSLKLRLVAIQDAITSVVPLINKTYDCVFDRNGSIQADEGDLFSEVMQGSADFTICDNTDPSIELNQFTRLVDDKGALPIDTPSPIVRDDVIRKAPEIVDILNRLAPLLTTKVSSSLQQQLLNSQSTTGIVLSGRSIAHDWLVSQKLLT
jgi:serine/threonine protein kinase